MAEGSHGLMPHQGDHHPWASRDWADIPCRRTSCMNHDGAQGMCGLPSQCNIDENGRCVGYISRKPQK